LLDLGPKIFTIIPNTRIVEGLAVGLTDSQKQMNLVRLFRILYCSEEKKLMKKKLSNIEKAMRGLEDYFFEGVEEVKEGEESNFFESKIADFAEFFAIAEMHLFQEVGLWNDLAELKAASTEFNLAVYKRLMELYDGNKCPDCGSQLEACEDDEA